MENNEVNVRKYGSQDQETVEKESFIWDLVDEIRLKTKITLKVMLKSCILNLSEIKNKKLS